MVVCIQGGVIYCQGSQWDIGGAGGCGSWMEKEKMKGKKERREESLQEQKLYQMGKEKARLLAEQSRAEQSTVHHGTPAVVMRANQAKYSGEGTQARQSSREEK
eukprot:747479-Hanusia_phi.AAC.2